MKIQKIILFLLITSTSLFENLQKKLNTPMNVDNADTNIDENFFEINFQVIPMKMVYK